jgi:hypothetical protein
VFGPIENDAADIERSIESFASVPNSGPVLLPDSTLIDELTVRIDRCKRCRAASATMRSRTATAHHYQYQ